jgi:hypothetical protein
MLAVSIADGNRIKALLGGNPINRDVVIAPIEGSDDISISVLQ